MAYSFYRTITVDKTQVGSTDRTDFPVLVKLSHATLKDVGHGGHVQNSSGYDIVFSPNNDGSSPYSWEMVKYDNVNGTVEAWVKVPTVSHSTNTVFNIVYGNAAISTFQGGSAGAAWNSAYKHVVHGGDGSTLDLNDKTTNGTNGTNSSASATTGKIGGGIAVTAGSKYTLAGNLANIVGGTVKHSIEMWVYETTQTATSYIWDLDTANSLGAFCNLGNGAQIQWGYGGGGGFRTYTVTLPSAGTWFHLAFEKSASGDNGDCYINGVRQATFSGALGDPNVSATPGAQFGAYHTSSATSLDGRMDELRISNTNRGADWYLTSYNNQNAPGDIGTPGFYTVGSETAGTITTTQTESGVARITGTTQKTENGVARITVATQKTITGKARIQKSTTQTETGVGRITGTTLKTETGVARVQVSVPKTILGVSRITGTSLKTESGISRITAITLRTETGISRIGAIANKTITGLSRVTLSTVQTINGTARIQKTPTQTETGVARVTAISAKNEIGVSNIQLQTTKNITGVAKIVITAGVHTETGVARIQKTRNRTILGKAFIIVSGTVTNAEKLQMPFDANMANEYSPDGGGFFMP